MKRKPELPDSVIEWQRLVSSQLLTSKELNDNKRQRQGVAYGNSYIQKTSAANIRVYITPLVIYSLGADKYAHIQTFTDKSNYKKPGAHQSAYSDLKGC